MIEDAEDLLAGDHKMKQKQKAAAKIQANYRGRKTRRELAKNKKNKQEKFEKALSVNRAFVFIKPVRSQHTFLVHPLRVFLPPL